MSESPQQTAPAGRMPGEEGVWVFIFGDLAVFGLFFLTYLTYRAADPALYAASRAELSAALGFLNTLILLTSSWFVAQAVKAVREGRQSSAPGLIMGGILLGLGFVVVKVVEYSQKFAAGITVVTDEFFMFYFMYTGIHLLHVLIGLGVLVFLFRLSRLETASDHVSSFESGGAFWHLVDLLWVVLVALLYLAP
jgi:nitric oxide reductase NorE protein